MKFYAIIMSDGTVIRVDEAEAKSLRSLLHDESARSIFIETIEGALVQIVFAHVVCIAESTPETRKRSDEIDHQLMNET